MKLSSLGIYGLATIFIGSVLLTGCPPKKKLEIDEKAMVDEELQEEQAADAELGETAFEVGTEWTEVPALETVTFQYDSAQVQGAEREKLKANVAILKKLPASVSIRVEGHCDDRGTVEYNIALGQRRANAVRQFYSTSGIAKGRLESISYGEERPVCNIEAEDCWARNRRAVTKLRSGSRITVDPAKLK